MNLLLSYTDSAGRERSRVLRGSIAVGQRAVAGGIRLEDGSVAGFHAVIDAEKTPPTVAMVAKDAALFVNGLLVKNAPLFHGDVVRFGDVEARVVLATRWAEIASNPPGPVLSAPSPATPAPSRSPEQVSGTPFPFLRVAAVTAALFGAAFGIYSARNVKWRAPLDQEDARLAEGRAQNIRALLGQSPTAGAIATPIPVNPVPPPRKASSIPGTLSSTSSAPAENALGTAIRSVVSITGDVRVDGQRGTVLGSGFFVSETGLILTNAHVMDHEGQYFARTHDGRYLVLMDRERDRKRSISVSSPRSEKDRFRCFRSGRRRT